MEFKWTDISGLPFAPFYRGVSQLVSPEVSNTLLHSVTLRGKSCSAVSGFWQERFAAF
jgi:hypothetical protein